VLAAAAALRVALAAFDPNLLTGSDCARVAEELAVTEKACSSVRLLTAARAVSAGAHRSAGFKDGAGWLARQSGVSAQQAKRDLQTADQLEGCPETRDALLSGQISMAQAAEITQAEADTPGVEHSLLPVARTGDLSKLRDQARQERQARTPVDDLHARQRRARFFRHWRDRLGMVCFSGQLTPEIGVPFIHRLERAAERARRAARSASPEGPPEKWEAHAADAFAEVCAGSAGSKRSDRTELVIVCDLFAWRRGHTHPGEICQIIDGGPIPVDVAKELTRDAFLKAALHDGVAIHTVKHFGRYYPVELCTALDLGPVPEFTGRQCAECGARWGLQYDHIDPVGHQGPTTYDNIQALCWTDHDAKTKRDRDAGLIRPRPRGRSPADP
jgi:5-methylcytosine-specific restriction endonuclease McrA